MWVKAMGECQVPTRSIQQEENESEVEWLLIELFRRLVDRDVDLSPEESANLSR